MENKLRGLEKQSTAREQEWSSKTATVAGRAAVLSTESEQLRADLAAAQGARATAVAAADSQRDTAAEHLAEVERLRAEAAVAAEAHLSAREGLKDELSAQLTQLQLEVQQSHRRAEAAESKAEASAAELACWLATSGDAAPRSPRRTRALSSRAARRAARPLHSDKNCLPPSRLRHS